MPPRSDTPRIGNDASMRQVVLSFLIGGSGSDLSEESGEGRDPGHAGPRVVPACRVLELAVASTAEAVTANVATGSFDGRGAVVAGVTRTPALEGAHPDLGR